MLKTLNVNDVAVAVAVQAGVPVAFYDPLFWQVDPALFPRFNA